MHEIFKQNYNFKSMDSGPAKVRIPISKDFSLVLEFIELVVNEQFCTTLN